MGTFWHKSLCHALEVAVPLQTAFRVGGRAWKRASSSRRRRVGSRFRGLRATIARVRRRGCHIVTIPLGLEDAVPLILSSRTCVRIPLRNPLSSTDPRHAANSTESPTATATSRIRAVSVSSGPAVPEERCMDSDWKYPSSRGPSTEIRDGLLRTIFAGCAQYTCRMDKTRKKFLS